MYYHLQGEKLPKYHYFMKCVGRRVPANISIDRSGPNVACANRSEVNAYMPNFFVSVYIGTSWGHFAVLTCSCCIVSWIADDTVNGYQVVSLVTIKKYCLVLYEPASAKHPIPFHNLGHVYKITCKLVNSIQTSCQLLLTAPFTLKLNQHYQQIITMLNETNLWSVPNC